MAANTHPDHDTLATFRRRFLKEVEALFVQVLVLAREMKLLKLGHIALDGTKIGANASKHKALSWAHANKIEAQLRQSLKGIESATPTADAQVTASLLVAFMQGRLQRFARSGFKRLPSEHLQAVLTKML